MKKLFIIMTLFISSFFLFNNKVKADVTIADGDIEKYITEDFLVLRETAINFAKENNYHYIFVYEPNYTFHYYFYFYDKNSTYSYRYLYAPRISIKNYVLYHASTKDNFKYNNSSSSYEFNMTASIILEVSEDIYIPDSFNITYNDLTYTVNESNKFVTYYDIYCDLNNIVEENPFEEEIEKVDNFYKIVMEKISYLASEFSNNYILLSIVGIFFIILIFEIVFRRYL